MNPHQKNKIDINSLSSDEQRLFRLYGKLPNKKDLLQNKLKERKYFDSGDYALSKAGKAGDSGVTSIGTEHPKAEEIPHAMSPLTTVSRSDSIAPISSNNPLSMSPGENGNPMGPGMHRSSINGIPGGNTPGVASRSPIKESSFLARSASQNAEEEGDEQMQEGGQKNTIEGNVNMAPQSSGIPIRR